LRDRADCQSLGAAECPRKGLLCSPTAMPSRADRGLIRPGGCSVRVGRIDASGRVTDRAIAFALGWREGERLTPTASPGVVTARREAGGMVTVPIRACIAIPAVLRRRCGLWAGDRVLLAAVPSHGPPWPGSRPRRPPHLVLDCSRTRRISRPRTVVAAALAPSSFSPSSVFVLKSRRLRRSMLSPMYA
jgi:hypothetical protein